MKLNSDHAVPKATLSARRVLCYDPVRPRHTELRIPFDIPSRWPVRGLCNSRSREVALSKLSDLPGSKTVSPYPEGVGGEGGIRTPVTLSGKAVFKTAAINRSATSPSACVRFRAANVPVLANMAAMVRCDFGIALKAAAWNKLDISSLGKAYLAKRRRRPALICKKFTFGLVWKSFPLKTLLMATS